MRDLYHCKIPKRYSSFFLSALRSFFIQTRCFLDIVDGLVHLYYGIVLFKSHIIKVESVSPAGKLLKDWKQIQSKVKKCKVFCSALISHPLSSKFKAQQSNGLISFSYFLCFRATTCAALPVLMVSFEARKTWQWILVEVRGLIPTI